MITGGLLKEKKMSVSFRYVSTPEGVKTEPCNPSELIKALAPPTDANLVHQGAEAAARAKMFMRNIDVSLAAHYSVLEQRLTALAMKMERC